MRKFVDFTWPLLAVWFPLMLVICEAQRREAPRHYARGFDWGWSEGVKLGRAQGNPNTFREARSEGCNAGFNDGFKFAAEQIRPRRMPHADEPAAVPGVCIFGVRRVR